MKSTLMKVTAVLVLSTLLGTMVWADSKEAETYVKIVYIEKIAPHQLGYQVDYRTSSGYIVRTYLPMKLFSGTAGKGELMYSMDKNVPYMEIIYQKGKFSMVRLWVYPSYDHSSWTVMNSGVDWTSQFNIEEPVFKY